MKEKSDIHPRIDHSSFNISPSPPPFRPSRNRSEDVLQREPRYVGKHPNNNNNNQMYAPDASRPVKNSAPVSKSGDDQSVLKRLQSELMTLMMCGDPGISAFPEGDNIFTWIGTITGSKDTIYEGMVYKLSLSFSNDYPFKTPKVKFDSTCFHPNVDTSGNICLDILQDKWSSAYNVRTILLSLQSLLGEPNNESLLNTQVAALWNNQEEFRKIVEKTSKPPHGNS